MARLIVLAVVVPSDWSVSLFEGAEVCVVVWVPEKIVYGAKGFPVYIRYPDPPFEQGGVYHCVTCI